MSKVVQGVRRLQGITIQRKEGTRNAKERVINTTHFARRCSIAREKRVPGL